MCLDEKSVVIFDEDYSFTIYESFEKFEQSNELNGKKENFDDIDIYEDEEFSLEWEKKLFSTYKLLKNV